MKRDNINYFAVGVFVLSMLCVMLFLLYRLTGAANDTEIYYVKFHNVSGLISGTPVTYEGFVIGNVDDVVPIQKNNGTEYRITLQIKDSWNIPADSTARIYAAGLLADTVVDIREGQHSRHLQPGEEIIGVQEDDMFTVMNSVAAQFGELSQTTLKPLLSSVKETIDEVGGQLQSSVPILVDRSQRLLVQLDASVQQVHKLLEATNEVRISNIVKNVESTSENFHSLSAAFHHTQQELDSLIAQSNSLVGNNAQTITASIQSLHYSLDTLANRIDEIVYHLEDSSRNMNEFSRNIRHSPGLLLRGKGPAENLDE